MDKFLKNLESAFIILILLCFFILVLVSLLEWDNIFCAIAFTICIFIWLWGWKG